MNDSMLVDASIRIRQWPEQMNPRLIIPCGALGGLVLGVIARAWMRWISTDPEFSWSGTIFIVSAFVLFCTAHSVVLFGRRKVWSRPWLTVSRVGAVIFSLPLFGAAGAAMLPTVLTGALATGRTNWPRPVRVLIFVLGLIIPGFIVRDIGSDFGWNLITAGRIILFVSIYSIVIAAARVTAAPLRDSWRMNRVHRVTLWVVVVGVGLFAVNNFLFQG